MFQALFCILGDKSEQNKAPFSNGIYLVRRETEQNTSKHMCNISIKIMLLRKVTWRMKKGMLGWCATGIVKLVLIL